MRAVREDLRTVRNDSEAMREDIRECRNDTKECRSEISTLKEAVARIDERTQSGKEGPPPSSSPRARSIVKDGAVYISTAGLGSFLLWGLQKLLGG